MAPVGEFARGGGQFVFDNFIRGVFKDILKAANWVAAIWIAALVALSFFTFAAFVRCYGANATNPNGRGGTGVAT